MSEHFRKMDIITLILILVIAVTSSLPVLIIASIFGFISIWVILTWVTPFIPLLICMGIGWFLWDKTKEANPTLANGILIAFVAIGIFLMLYVGYGLFQSSGGGTVYRIYPGGT